VAADPSVWDWRGWSGWSDWFHGGQAIGVNYPPLGHAWMRFTDPVHGQTAAGAPARSCLCCGGRGGCLGRSDTLPGSSGWPSL